ncbi:MAG: MGMT family protein [Candidatus Aenigmatarchaeota archaeon]
MQEKNILRILKKIPKGRVTTYKLLGKKLKLHPRVVARLLSKNKDLEIPCYKVIYSNGRIGGYSKGIHKKIEKLKKDGIEIKKHRIDLNKFLFKFS